jgi:hypothetical protein
MTGVLVSSVERTDCPHSRPPSDIPHSTEVKRHKFAAVTLNVRTFVDRAPSCSRRSLCIVATCISETVGYRYRETKSVDSCSDTAVTFALVYPRSLTSSLELEDRSSIPVGELMFIFVDWVCASYPIFTGDKAARV